MTTVQITLPDQLAQEAAQIGLLQPQALEALLRGAMREHRIERLFATMERLRATGPDLTEEEVQAEIDACRAERRARYAARS
jgi:hypothetical protein